LRKLSSELAAAARSSLGPFLPNTAVRLQHRWYVVGGPERQKEAFNLKYPRNGITDNMRQHPLYWAAGAAGVGYFGWKWLAKEQALQAAPNSPGANTPPSSGDRKLSILPSVKTKLLETGGDIMQSFKPLKNVHAHMCGAHFYNGELDKQVLAHHYCGHLNDEMQQCLIYDSDGEDARLIGVEFVITESLFQQLPEQEKRLWHSHAYEVKSGLLIAPGLPSMAERSLMKDLVSTYGKTWHFWQIDRGDKLPLGEPKLMMAFTQDGQLNATTIGEIERHTKESLDAKRRERYDIKDPIHVSGADDWERGTAVQLKLVETGVSK